MISNQQIRIGVIGCGNMASALVKGIHSVYPEINFVTYTPSFTRAEELAKAVNGQAVESLKDFKDIDTLMIACKPQQFANLSRKLSKAINLEHTYILSIMAAVSLQSIENQLKASKITRIMPNTPSMLNKGVSLLLHSDAVNLQEAALTEKLFKACGTVHLMETQEQFDQVTTVSGSGPAYVFQFAESLEKQLKLWKVSDGEARAIVNQLFLGASMMMQKNKDLSLSALLDQVTSKGGVTIEAVKEYRKAEIEDITQKALVSAYNRSLELTSLY